MTLKYLITGATGGLGSDVLAHLVANLPSSEYAAASSSEANRERFEKEGIAFRVTNFDDPLSLDIAFEDVENLFFVSTNVFDTERRSKQHQNVVDAAKRKGVRHVWYTSLAFGGLRSDSKIDVQQAHLQTERMLKESGVTYTSIREGIYTEAFPLFIGWYPGTETVYIPQDGPVTYTSREELAEANAKLMIKGGHQNEIVLLTADEAVTASDLVILINETTGRTVRLQIVSVEDYIQLSVANDEGKKPVGFWKKRVSWFDGIAKGDATLNHSLMAELLGRRPRPASDVIRDLLKANPNYTWHQNYIEREKYLATLSQHVKV